MNKDECMYYVYKDNEYYCLLMDKILDHDWVKRYCWGYHCDECPHFKAKG